MTETNEQNNRYDSFETHHFDEGKPCGEPSCTSLVQRSLMLMQKRPLLGQGGINNIKMTLEVFVKTIQEHLLYMA